MFLTLYHFVSALPEAERMDCAWDFPYARALWLYFTKCETDGTYRIENAKERQVQDELDQYMREIEEEKRAEKLKADGGAA